MYAFRSSLGPVELAFTDRFGGVSGVPYDELNLALESDDDPESVAENWRLLLADFAPGARLADMHQVHGNRVHTLPTSHDRGASGRPECDGIVTTQAEVVLAVRVADCVPVLLADPEAGVVGAAHSGRVGLVTGVVPATVERMRALGTSRITAWLGPHICGACYEVPEDMRADVAGIEPSTQATTSWGTPSLDLGAGIRSQLQRLDVEIVDVSRCTRESRDLYSHRRDGRAAGRQVGVIGLRG